MYKREYSIKLYYQHNIENKQILFFSLSINWVELVVKCIFQTIYNFFFVQKTIDN